MGRQPPERVPDNPEAKETRGPYDIAQEFDSIRYELRVRLAGRSARTQMVIWCYEDGAIGVALMPVTGSLTRVQRWKR